MKDVQERGALTLVAPIALRHLFPLARVLRRIGRNIRSNPYIDFSKLRTTHFLRWVILPGCEEAGLRARLVFESNHDGTREEYLTELLETIGPALRLIYSHCEGYLPAYEQDAAAFKAYLLRSARPSAAFFRAYPRLTAEDIQRNALMRQRLHQLVDSPTGQTLRHLAREELHALIQRNLLGERPVVESVPPVMSRRERVIQWFLGSRTAQVSLAVLVSPALLPAAALLLFKEWRDEAEAPPRRVKPRVFQLEDHVCQNQLTHLVDVKPGWLRLGVLKLVLRSVDFLSKYKFTEGRLGDIATVHFGRWILLEGPAGRHQLLFFSNYDGSWEHYLTEFINRASTGLTAIWSNTHGFPKTRLLIFKGSREEQAFKRWTRNHQLSTQVWYSAHADLSICNILADAQLMAGLRRPPVTRAELEKWFRLC